MAGVTAESISLGVAAGPGATPEFMPGAKIGH
jgi:hypothetical protein